MDSKLIGYWRWFAKGSGTKPGYRRLFNLWCFLHIVIGVLVAYLVQLTMVEAASAVLFPLAGIFVGFSFAWAVSAQALMQSKEIDMFTEHFPGGLTEYIYIYQTAVLAILATLIFWGFAGLGIFDDFWPTKDCTIAYFIVKAVLFALCSLSIRECWQVINGTHQLVLIRRIITKAVEQKQKMQSEKKD